MSGKWAGSTRRKRLPPDWNKIRQDVFRRDHYTCTIPECGRPANQCDHVIPNDDDSMENLTSLCGPHHAKKSSAEGNAARARYGVVVRPPEQHPGLL